MPRVDLRIHTLAPEEPWWPDDDRLGELLVGAVRGALSRGGAPTMGVVARRDAVHLVPLLPLARAGVPLPVVLGGLARWDEGAGLPEAVGLVGRVRVRRRRGPWSPLALVFLEWPDGRWWEWRALEGADGELVADTEGIARAVDGLPRPGGLGGGGTLARRRRPQLRLERRVPVRSEIVQ